jgi:hypothetical protein
MEQSNVRVMLDKSIRTQVIDVEVPNSVILKARNACLAVTRA